MSQTEILNYSQNLCDLLSRNANFIIEDYSGSVGFPVEPQMLLDGCDVIVLVLDASVSAVRNAKRLIDKIENLQLTLSSRLRIITVVNFHRPESAYVMDKNDIKRYLGQEPSLEMAFCKHLSHIIIDGKRVYKHDRHMKRSFDDLVKHINGQPVSVPRLNRWLGKVRAK
jgi:pilus assembly protein CpaE